MLGICLKDIEGLKVGDEVRWKGQWRGVAMDTKPDDNTIAVFLAEEDESHFNAPVGEIADVRRRSNKAA